MALENKSYILEQLSAKNPRLLTGVQTILHDDNVFKRFESALVFLSNAEDTSWLLKTEAALQTTINEVIDLNHRDAQKMNDAKAALYISTLQDLIFCLSNWQLKNDKENNYVPEISRKYNEVLMEGTKHGLDPELINNLCFSKEYKNKNNDDPYLANFEFLDESRIKNTKQKILQYAATNNLEVFSERQPAAAEATAQASATVELRDHGVVQCKDSTTELVDKVIGIVKAKWGSEKVNYDYIANNLGEFVKVVNTIIPLEAVAADDKKNISKLVKTIVDRVREYDKLQTMQTQNQMTDDTMVWR